jgi:hypothetical protein
MHWSCGVTLPGIWCREQTVHAFWYAAAIYEAGTTLPVCEKTIRTANNTTYQETCGNIRAEAWFPLCECGGLEAAVKQAIDGIHTNGHRIDGYGAY